VVLMTSVPTNAFKVTGISNTGSITVGQSNVAGLAVSASAGNSINQVTYSGGQVQVHFGKGTGGTVFAFQTSRTQSTLSVAADDIKMLNVLTVTNNSGYCQDVAVWVSSGTAVNLTNIYGRPPGGAQPGTLLGTSNRVQKLQVGGQMVVDFWWNATSTVTSPGTFTLTVKGTQSASCP
ncbi:MAG TPA: hypothetical protein VK191_17535, partial [Symbiobacteriaceae bacterium]|nr:hypothetical protein [Symbiobacteriaceae bacterium]